MCDLLCRKQTTSICEHLRFCSSKYGILFSIPVYDTSYCKQAITNQYSQSEHNATDAAKYGCVNKTKKYIGRVIHLSWCWRLSLGR